MGAKGGPAVKVTFMDLVYADTQALAVTIFTSFSCQKAT